MNQTNKSKVKYINKTHFQTRRFVRNNPTWPKTYKLNFKRFIEKNF